MTGPRIQANAAQKNTEPACKPEQEPARQSERGLVPAVAPQVAYRCAQINRSGLMPADVLVLQHTMGNCRTQQMLAQRIDGVNGQPQRAFSERNSRTKVQSPGQP